MEWIIIDATNQAQLPGSEMDNHLVFLCPTHFKFDLLNPAGDTNTFDCKDSVQARKLILTVSYIDYIDRARTHAIEAHTFRESPWRRI